MPTNFTGYLAGFERAQLFFTDATGAATGILSPLGNGLGSGAYVAKNVKTAGFAPTPITDLEIQGGDAIRASISFGNQKTKQFQLIVSDYDTQLIQLVSGSVMNQTNTLATVIAENAMRQIPRVMGVALQRRFTLPNLAGQYYEAKIFPNCQVRIHEGPFGYQAEADTVLDITPNITTADITGASFGVSGLAMGLQGNETDSYSYISQGGNPIHIYSFRGDGSIVTFTTPFAPVNTLVTLNTTTNAWFKAGAATALTSITALGVATLAVAPTVGQITTLIYETLYVPTS